ncbi:CAAX prenyl protease-related protein [Massilia sp. W12]|uniref:CAAX prenyl protease-related protein n=1 Tax=Massilia sp. W12 TaxID=3126507 RepID=UPI0030CCE67B
MLTKPMLARCLPFAIYILFLAIEDLLGKVLHVSKPDLLWLYPVKISLVMAALWYFRHEYDELRRAMGARALALSLGVGVLVFVLWINANLPWMLMGEGRGYDPHTTPDKMNWFLVGTRIFGATLVVPLMEELFYRSFLQRWLVKPDFQQVDPNAIPYQWLLAVSLVFAVSHTEWFAGVIAGLAYGFLYMKSRNLWTAVFAHAVTNGVLGVWVLQTGNWQYW